MRFMNQFDIEAAVVRFDRAGCPNRYAAAKVIDRLSGWADANSDGWAYWPKPARAAARLMDLVDSWTLAERRAQEADDATDAEFKAALRPVKAFLTRQGVDHSEVIR